MGKLRVSWRGSWRIKMGGMGKKKRDCVDQMEEIRWGEVRVKSGVKII